MTTDTPAISSASMTETDKAERIEAYEARIEARREHYAELAIKHADASATAYAGVRRILDSIPPGQPILVDHYSVNRHRADLSRMDRGMAASVKHQETAEYYADKAENYGTHGISSADPAALDKLRAELAELEKANEDAKAINRHFRKIGSLDNCPVEISEKLRAGIEKAIEYHRKYSRKPGSVVGTNGAEIKRIRDRIATLEKNAERGHVEREFSGGTCKEDPDENRINFYFDGKPEEVTRNILKQNGFKWSPSRKAWTRLLNNAARCAARNVINDIMGN